MPDLIKNIINNKVFRVGFLSLFSTVLVRAVNLICIPIFSRLLSPAEYGNVDVFINYANIFMLILGLDTHAGIAKAKLDFKKDSNRYMSSNLIFTFFYSLIIIALINVLFFMLQGIFGLDRLETNIMLIYGYAMHVILFRTAENNFDFQYKKNIIMNGATALLNLGLSVVLVLTLFSQNRQSGRIIGITVPTVVCAVFVFCYICKRGRWRYKKKYLRYSLRFCIPLIPHNLSHIILSSADRIMIKNMISETSAGIYSLSYTLGMLLSVISEGMNQVCSPWLFRKINEGKIVDVTKSQRLYLLLYVIITIPVMMISPEIIKLISPEDYWDGTRIVIWVVFAVFLNFTYTLYVNIEFYYMKSVWISTGTILAAVINCVLNFIFLKQYGYIFGAFSTVISYIALLIFHMIIVNLILKKRYVDNIFVIIVVIVVFGITVCMNLLLSRVFLRILFGVILSCGVALITYILYKKQGKIDFGIEQ